MANTTATAEEQLIERYIEIDPRRRSADWARIKGYGMNVWALIGALGGDEASPAIAEVARGYDVPAEVVQAALAYYRRILATQIQQWTSIAFNSLFDQRGEIARIAIG